MYTCGCVCTNPCLSARNFVYESSCMYLFKEKEKEGENMRKIDFSLAPIHIYSSANREFHNFISVSVHPAVCVCC